MPRRRSRSPSKAGPDRIEQPEGKLNWATSGDEGDERRQRRRTEAKQTDLHGQKREREEAERMPHTAMVETVGARRNRAAKPSATHSRQRE
jgi:hypothetical protein